jgi:uncharacterized 2Fe-2S/4Fe-4S cluster protein (DUF4445 family)
MKKEITMTFEPLGIRVRTETGRTIFDVARENGLAIRSECGGKGFCGKCKVIVYDLNAVSKLTNEEEKHLTTNEVHRGFRLACLTKIQSDLLVTIPRESRIVARRLQLFGVEKHVKIDVNIEKIHLTLSKPTLKDVKADLERLTEAVKQFKASYKGLRVDYNLLKKLPEILRNENWDVTVVIWNKGEIINVEGGNTTDRIYGLTIDVGTSKIIIHIISLSDGKTVGTGAIENPQMMYGEDVISRITYAIKNRKYLRKLQSLLINGINKALVYACEDANVSRKNIYEAILVGNTAMHHFFFGILPKYVSLSPYVPALRRSICVKAREVGVKMNPSAVICSLPIIGGFVGSDAVADVLATEICEADKPSLLLDIGTNTEIFLGDKNRLLCCSCASGPAFEGIHIKHGVKAVDGAIETVKIESLEEIKFTTINNAPPIGICGTGIIDTIAEMFKKKVIDSNGRFRDTVNGSRLKKLDGEKCFVVVRRRKGENGREIVITQGDINKVQLAKAAIFAGCSVLMRKMGLSFKDINKVLIAGAFGSHLNPENAKILGLVPDVNTNKIEFVGNAAIVGGKKALLSMSDRQKGTEIMKKTIYVELAIEPDFTAEFSKALFIPHRELKRFPSVKNCLEK